MANLFESETCSRCGGSGHYSYCRRYGTTCFKCAGRKEVLTKRGSAAQALFTRLLSMPVSSLQPGMKIKSDGITWTTVSAVEPDETLYNGKVNPNMVTVKSEGKSGVYYAGMDRNKLIRVAANAEVKAWAFMIASSYQSCLNKNGSEPSWLSMVAWG